MQIKKNTSRKDLYNYSFNYSGHDVTGCFSVDQDLEYLQSIEPRHIKGITAISEALFLQLDDVVDAALHLIVYQVRRSTAEDLR